MKKFVVDTCAEFDVPLSIIKPDVDIDVYQDMYGLPSDIIPMTRSPEFRYFNKKNKCPKEYCSWNSETLICDSK